MGDKTTAMDILKRMKKQATSQQKEKPVKPAQGKSVWRILPATEGLEFYHPYGEHWVKDLEGNVKAVVGCPEKTYGESCEICDMISAAVKKVDDDEQRNAIKDAKANQVFLVNAVKPDEDPSKVYILQLGKMLFNAVTDAIDEYQPDGVDDRFVLLDPEEGQDLVINREGSGLETKYSVTVRPASKSKPVSKSALMARKDLNEYVRMDFEEKKERALEAIGSNAGMVASGAAAGALTGPAGSKPSTTKPGVDDDLPEFDEDDVIDAVGEEVDMTDDADDKVETKSADAPEETSDDAPEGFGEDVPADDDDLDDLINSI